jgi:hypothetical protein
MMRSRPLHIAAGLLAAAGLALLATGSAAQPPAYIPDPSLQALVFSVAAGDPVTVAGTQPADLLALSGTPLIACDQLGLLCQDASSSAQDDLKGLSYGSDFYDSGLAGLYFSVGRTSTAQPGTAVALEAGCTPPEAHADLFLAPLDGNNLQGLDGNGIACTTNAGLSLYVSEGVPSDNIDAIGRDPCLTVDLNCDGTPENPVYFSLAPGSPSLALVGAGPADILVSSNASIPQVWVAGQAQLGLQPLDVIDALCLQENGDGVFGPGDQLLFSLAPGSPGLARLQLSAADLLRPPPARLGISASALGLKPGDDVDALLCDRSLDFHDLFLPLARLRQ